jgi:hypothetical protein
MQPLIGTILQPLVYQDQEVLVVHCPVLVQIGVWNQGIPRPKVAEVYQLLFVHTVFIDFIA